MQKVNKIKHNNHLLYGCSVEVFLPGIPFLSDLLVALNPTT